jgi:type I restriction enzyme S subunit
VKTSFLWCNSLVSQFPIVPIKFGFDLIGSGTTPPSQHPKYYGGEFPWVTSSELRENRIFETRQTVSVEAKAEFSSLKDYPRDSVLFAMYGATIGRTGILGVPACVNQAVCALAQPVLFDSDFAHYALIASRDYLVSESSGGSQPNLNAEKVREHKLPCPSIETQRRIASYLDRETSEIDRLIAAKERILTLLAEKRRAIITHAVNNGLDDKVEKSRTELPWFGFSPRHWEIRKFTQIVKITEGQVSPDDDAYSSLPLIAPNHIESGTGRLINLETAEEQAAISGKYLCKAGDVIYSKIRPALQKVVIAPQECLCSADMYPMATTNELLPRFLFWLLLGDSFSTWAILESGRVAMPKVNRESLGELRIPVPPIREQCQICDYIDSQVERLDLLRQACLRSVSILNERRSALIAAAVTGQIAIEEEDK